MLSSASFTWSYKLLQIHQLTLTLRRIQCGSRRCWRVAWMSINYKTNISTAQQNCIQDYVQQTTLLHSHF